jgi:glucose-1-phosphate cytidylyltransferase
MNRWNPHEATYSSTFPRSGATGSDSLKVVLFCGGLGLRMGEGSPRIPKPMVTIGNRPILWHIMKYYAHYGHTDFILCLGHRGEVIKDYFLNYNEALANDFVLSEGGKHVELLRDDMRDWRITFVDTGIHANVGQRLKAVQSHLSGEAMFLANYGDGVTDAPLPQLISDLVTREKTASFLCVRPANLSFHAVSLNEAALVKGIRNIAQMDMWINAGFFVFKQEIFDYLEDGEELVHEPFQRLIDQEQLMASRYEGFWAPMDTLKDKHNLEQLLESGRAPWRVWDASHAAEARPEKPDEGATRLRRSA